MTPVFSVGAGLSVINCCNDLQLLISSFDETWRLIYYQKTLSCLLSRPWVGRMTIASIETLDITWRQKVENEPIINLVQSNGKGLTGNIYKVENNQITCMVQSNGNGFTKNVKKVENKWITFMFQSNGNRFTRNMIKLCTH